MNLPSATETNPERNKLQSTTSVKETKNIITILYVDSLHYVASSKRKAKKRGRAWNLHCPHSPNGKKWHHENV